ncbi:MAG: hypothetical protein AB9856_21605 [Cellulosilyticaceae bacterium]
MDNKKVLRVLTLFYYGQESIIRLSQKAGVTREEAREILKGARECGLISYSTKDYSETFVRIKKDKLKPYLEAKGCLKTSCH